MKYDPTDSEFSPSSSSSPTYPFSTGLPICAWVWGHPVQHGEPTSGSTLKRE